MSSVDGACYVHGHHASVMKSLTWRTANNSAAYLLPLVETGASILDVGCGPGTITVDFADLVGDDGYVIGVDQEPEIICKAKATREGKKNLSFRVGDVTKGLPFKDKSFDIVHAHQVLQHLRDPVAALREMKRVCRDDGIVAVRDADYHGMVWTPQLDGMNLWMAKYQEAARNCGGDPDAGRSLLRYTKGIGFKRVESSASVWCFADDEDKQWWGNLWAERIEDSQLTIEMRKVGTSEDEIDEMKRAWLQWSKDEGAWFTVLHSEVLCFT